MGDECGQCEAVLWGALSSGADSVSLLCRPTSPSPLSPRRARRHRTADEKHTCNLSPAFPPRE